MPALPAASRYSESRNSMSAVPLDRVSRAGRPTAPARPWISGRRSSLRSSWCRARPSVHRGIHRGRSASARSFPARWPAARRRRRRRPAAIRYRPACRRALRRRRRAFGLASVFVAGLASGLAARVLLVVLLVLVGLFGRRLADRDAVVEAEHDDDGVGLLGRRECPWPRRPSRPDRPWADT